MQQDTSLSPNGQVDETFVVHGIRPDGFTLLYNDAAELLIPEHSAVAKCYLALCILSNGNRSAHPSLSGLGKMMGGMSEDTARRAVNRLEELDLLFIHRPQNQGRGSANVYTLTRPEGSQNKGSNHATLPQKGSNGRPEGSQNSGERVAPAMQPQQVTNNQRTNNTSRARENDDGWRDDVDIAYGGPVSEGRGPIQHHPERPQPQAQRRENSSVSNQKQGCKDGGVYGEDCAYNTLEEELAHPFWTPVNVEYFKALIEPYPKHKLGQQHLSMHAWRTVVGEQAAEQAWADQYWRGLHNWLMKWDAEKTEPQWIPWFPNFIKNKKWQGTPPPPPK